MASIMMRKTFKYISVFSLWLAGLIMSAHLIIPHDHHLADSFSNQDKNCPASNNDSKHPAGFPVHCHAFNVLASERLRPIHVFQNIQYIFISCIGFSERSAFELPVSYVRIIGLQRPVLDPTALDLSLLRAPPVSI